MVDMTIGRLWRSGVWGDFTDLVCIGRIFSQTSLKLEFFPLYNFFSALYIMSDIFFNAGYFSPRNLFACFFPLKISLQEVKWSALKLHQTFGQLTDSDLSIISEGVSRACRLHYKVATQKTFWIHTSNIVWGVSRGVGPVWIRKWARNAEVSQDFCPWL